MTLPAKIVAQKNKLDTKYPWLNLIEFQLNDSQDQVKRFVRNYEDLYWLSEKYWDTGCVAHWKMNDNAANKLIADSSPNGLNGISIADTNTMTVAGKINTALEFDGAVDYGRAAHNTLLNFGAGDFAISIWFKTTAAGQRCIAAKATAGLIGWYIGLHTTHADPYFLIGDAAGFTECHVPNFPGNLRDGNWHHQVVNVDRDGIVTFIVDGIVYPSSNISSRSGSINTSTDLAIGIYIDWSTTKFVGPMDDMRLYNRLLTIDEANLLYNAGAGTEKMAAKYESFNFSCSMIKESSEGEAPKTTLSVSNVSQFLQPWLEQHDGCTDSKIIFSIIHADNLCEDYCELQTEFDVIAPRITAMDVAFEVGAMSLLRQRFPLHRYFADLCRHRFENARCKYQRKTVAGVTLSGTNPVSIEVTAHNFSTGNLIRLAGIAGITPSLDDTYTITKTDANNFTLNGTNSSNFSGSYTSGGTAGYSVCGRRLADCRERLNSGRFGGAPSLAAGTIRFA